jgi:hypothetical protein
MKRENMDNMEDAIEAFIKANPSAGAIRAFVVDKDFKERKLLRKFFPHARILLCHYHVIKVFAKKVWYTCIIRYSVSVRVWFVLVV